MIRKGAGALTLLALGAYAMAAAAAAAAGFRYWIPWVVVQLLDQDALARSPVNALLALHSQPPLLNAGAALALRLGALLGCGPEPLLSVLFHGLAAAVVVLAAQLVRFATGSFGLGLGAGLLAAADPALHFFRSIYFYELPLAAFLLLALVGGARYLTRGSRSALWVFVVALVSMGLLRSLYHPVWVVAMVAVLAWGRARIAPNLDQRSAWRGPLVLMVVLLAVWPLKNEWLFHAPVMSSWEGYNLSRGTPVKDAALEQYVASGTVLPALEQEWNRRAPGFLRQAPVLVAPVKGTGHRNWNHYVFLLTYRRMVRESLRWRLEHPGEWLAQSLAYYLLWGRPTYRESYYGRLRGPDQAAYVRYAELHERLLFPDLRGLVAPLLPESVAERTTLSNGPAPYPLLSVVVLPLLLVLLAVLLPARLRRGDPGAWVALLATGALLWVVLVPCLTDGIEANRMRYPVSSCLLLLVAWAGTTLRRRPPRAGASPAGETQPVS
jgi:hypothetical protein